MARREAHPRTSAETHPRASAESHAGPRASVRRERPQPSGIERRFGDDETIVSKTDCKGRITYVNDVFRRVAAYPEDELVGQPQNIIRHPDMPAAGFKLLWDELQCGKETFAFIVNLAKDGQHYWVFAHMTASFDVHGRMIAYHSARRTVSQQIIRQLEPVYARIRAVERAAGRGPTAAAAGVDAMERMLAERGVTYQQWVWSIAEAHGDEPFRAVAGPGMRRAAA